jgi:DNA modification methylase
MTDEIKFDKRNYRKHNAENKRLIKKSLEECGAGRSILIDGEDEIIAGNGVYEQAKKLKMPVRIIETDGSEIVAIKRTDLKTNDEKRKQLAVMDNSTSDSSEFDLELMAEDFSVDQLDGMGVELPEVLLETEPEVVEDEIPEQCETRAKPGDIWQLGKHRLICGDSTKREEIARLMDGKQCQMVFTDPPYNVNYGNTMKDALRYHTKEKRTIMNDNLGGNFGQFLTDACKNIVEFCDGAIYICMSSSELHTLYSSFVEAGGKWSTFIIWAKNTFTLGRSDYQRQYEPILYGWPKDKKHYWCGDRDQSDVWEYNKPQKNDLHPTMKPIDLCARAVKNSSKKGQICGDFFGGSGSTLIACEQLGRICYMAELDPKYCDVILQRYENFTGDKPVLLERKE